MIEHPEYLLNSPVGYPYADRINKGDEGGLRRFALQLAGADEDMQKMIRESAHEQLISWFEGSHFTFDPEWYGVREIPENSSGTMTSALDDPQYRRSIGIIDRPPGA